MGCPGSSLSIELIHEARQRIAAEAVVTPLLRSAYLDEVTGGRILLKAENLQRTGSFKFRGAYNRISSIPEADRARGIIAVSSGNHAQGVAEAAWLLGLKATIVMPSDAPSIKVERCIRRGSEIVSYDRASEDREALVRKLAAESGATLVHPYDDHLVMAGQGTAGLEIADQAQGYGLTPDAVLTCCGGGGLTAGVALAVSTAFPGIAVHPVEPAGFDDTARSLAAGQRLRNDKATGSICDALLSPEPGALTFPVNASLLSAGISVTDEDVLKAMAFAFKELKLVVEPGGAVCLAALLSRAFDARGKTVVALLSGGNVTPQMMVRALEEA